ncbi:MAG: hypothetical protein J0M24_13575 [Verrucomicrobia bacterium]|nr:hypothetical protein [Verrucomicrobiota bacterium]
MKTTIRLGVFAAVAVFIYTSASLLSRRMDKTTVPSDSMRRTYATVNFVASPTLAMSLPEAPPAVRQRR